MKKISMFILIACCSISVNAQSVKFSSTYTNVLDSNCKSFDNEEYGDGYMICPAIEGYQLYVYYNVYGHEVIQVQYSDSTKKYSGSIAIDHCEDSQQYGTKMEWRYANGKPFAFIIRVSCLYIAEEYDEELKMNYEGFEQGDQYLEVVGLVGYESIQGEINVKTSKNANTAARVLADSTYLKLMDKE